MTAERIIATAYFAQAGSIHRGSFYNTESIHRSEQILVCRYYMDIPRLKTRLIYKIAIIQSAF